MFNLNQIQMMEMEHRKDLMQQAEKSRLIKSVRMNDQNRVRLHQAVLAWTGRSFVSWGNRLLKLSRQEQASLYQPNMMLNE